MCIRDSSNVDAFGKLKYPTNLWEYDPSELTFKGIGRNSYGTTVEYPQNINSEYLFENRNEYLFANKTEWRTYIFQQKAAAPSVPGDKTVQDLLANNAVTIDCINSAAPHANKTYGLLSGGYSIGSLQGNAASGYTVGVTVAPRVYVNQYSSDLGVAHALSPSNQGNKTITLEYVNQAWRVKQGAAPVVYTVMCQTATPTPVSYTHLDVYKRQVMKLSRSQSAVTVSTDLPVFSDRILFMRFLMISRRFRWIAISVI